MNIDTRSLPTTSPEFKRHNKVDLPPLVYYRHRSSYIPQYGDYVVWSRWFSTWHGVVKNYNNDSRELYVIFAGIPFLLFTMKEREQESETYIIKLSDIHNARNGKYAIQQQDKDTRTNIWYI